MSGPDDLGDRADDRSDVPQVGRGERCLRLQRRRLRGDPGAAAEELELRPAQRRAAVAGEVAAVGAEAADAEEVRQDRGGARGRAPERRERVEGDVAAHGRRDRAQQERATVGAPLMDRTREAR